MRRLELQNSRSEMYSVGNIVNNCVTRHRDHFEMYRNIESLCCVPGINIVLLVNYTSKTDKSKQTKQIHRKRDQICGYQRQVLGGGRTG